MLFNLTLHLNTEELNVSLYSNTVSRSCASFWTTQKAVTHCVGPDRMHLVYILNQITSMGCITLHRWTGFSFHSCLLRHMDLSAKEL